MFKLSQEAHKCIATIFMRGDCEELNHTLKRHQKAKGDSSDTQRYYEGNVREKSGKQFPVKTIKSYSQASRKVKICK